METESQANISHLNTGDEGEISFTQSDDQLDVVNRIGEEPIPLRMKLPAEENEQIKYMTEWIEEYIIKLSTKFGVDFKGCEKKAKELFLKIDNNSQHNKDMQLTVKKKGLIELKRLEIDNKFWSYGSRKGFKEKIKTWWESFPSTGSPDFVLVSKLRALKTKLKEWSKSTRGNLGIRKQLALAQLADLEEIQEPRILQEEEVVSLMTLINEFEEIAKKEEIAWRQRSRGKSFIYLINNVLNTKVLARTLGGKVGEHPTTYLGHCGYNVDWTRMEFVPKEEPS
ncbi:hypothetical protein MTR67_013881 [Solanum verrucosum]|uniref:Uncharacterized protein n=1 Tax=Solanum verrucosum TaxID=315347 RepID=A0AAF0TIB7_SOLVR|nr:hypothetical protein MTR67_013881 [Solanum verrucosum]